MVPSACAPTFAPAPWVGTAGAPGRLYGGDVELRGTTNGLLGSAGGSVPLVGGPAVAHAIDDRWAIEGGGEYASPGWALGHAGTRLTAETRARRWLRLAGDGELGAALGVGGSVCNRVGLAACDPTPWYRRIGGGGYLGAGAALRFPWLALYGRGRVQLAGARGVPATGWTQIAGGLELSLGRHVALWSAFGWGGYDNRVESAHFGVYELGLAVRWLPRRR